MAKDQNTPTPQTAMRLSELDFTRATSEAATVMGLLMGAGEVRKSPRDSGLAKTATSRQGRRPYHGLRPESARPLAFAAMLGCLNAGYCSVTVLSTYPKDNRGAPWLPEATVLGLQADRPEWAQEIVAIPVDGVRDILWGHDSGAISAVGVGLPGALEIPKELLEIGLPRCLLIGIGPSGDNNGNRLRDALMPMVPTFRGQTLFTVLQDLELSRLLSSFVMRISSRVRRQITVSTMEKDTPVCLRKLLHGPARLRAFLGSSVAAGIATFFPEKHGIDAFVAVLGLTHTILLSIAARATGGQLFAVPVLPVNPKLSRKKILDSVHAVSSGARLYEAQDFVRGDDAFLVATGITDSLDLPGLRFLGNGMIRSNSISLHVRNRSVRLIDHTCDIQSTPFHQFNFRTGQSNNINYNEVANIIERELTS